MHQCLAKLQDVPQMGCNSTAKVKQQSGSEATFDMLQGCPAPWHDVLPTAGPVARGAAKHTLKVAMCVFV